MIKHNIKCVIWDLDDTLWDGALLESAAVKLKPGITETIQVFDQRGIIQCIASKNNYDMAMAQLKQFELDQYFVYAEISWNAKSGSVGAIQAKLNININSILFIDDQDFELNEVLSVYPQVNTYKSNRLNDLLYHPSLIPRFVTVESRSRRVAYQAEVKRTEAESDFKGPKESFLASLDMRLSMRVATKVDLKRAEELTERTNQLNSTGETYSYDDLVAVLYSGDHQIIICELSDKFGDYGKIGLALIQEQSTCLRLKMMLMSCRVVTRGVGTVLLNYIMQRAKDEGKSLLAEFKDTGFNRMMYITFKFAEFEECWGVDENKGQLLECRLQKTIEYPAYIKIKLGHGL